MRIITLVHCTNHNTEKNNSNLTLQPVVALAKTESNRYICIGFLQSIPTVFQATASVFHAAR
jgi:hypothetical protein